MRDQLQNNPIEQLISKWFISAVYHDNLSKMRREKLFDIVSTANFIALLLIIIGEAIGGKIPASVVVVNIFLAMACLVLRHWIHQGNIELGVLVFMALVLIYTLVAIAYFGTVHTPPVAGYLLFVIGAEILFFRKGSAVASILSVLALLGFIAVEKSEFWTSDNLTLMISQLPLYSMVFFIPSSVLFWVFIVRQSSTRTDHQITELEASPIPIIITDGEGKIEYVNSKYTQLTGYALDEVKAKEAPFLQSERMQPEMRSKLWDTIQSGQVWQGEFQNQAKNGDSFFASYSITPITDELGQITYLVIIVKNISDRKRVEAERLVLNRTREFATLYEITHDLGNFLDRSTLFQTILERTMILLDVHAGAIYLLDADRREFNMVSDMGPSLQLGSLVSGDQWLSDNPAKIYMDSPLTVRVPIIHAGECLGMLILRMMQPGGSMVKKPNLNLLALIATQVASAIHNLDMFDQVRASRLRAQDLAKNILSAQEKERRLIARELHDEFGQELTSVHLGLQSIERFLNHANAQAKLNEIMETIEHVMEQMRSLSRALRPAVLDDFGLVPALEWIVEQQVKRAGLQAEIIADPFEVRLPEEIETVCFRVAQEAITNVLRHGHATRIVFKISLCYGRLELMIQDDGIGFDLLEAMNNVRRGNSLGLLSMNERVELVGGQMQIITAPGQGTQIQVSLPVNPDTLTVGPIQVNGGAN